MYDVMNCIYDVDHMNDALNCCSYVDQLFHSNDNKLSSTSHLYLTGGSATHGNSLSHRVLGSTGQRQDPG